MNSDWSYSPKTAKWGHGLCNLDLWPLTLSFCMDITSVISNNSWKPQDGTMMETQWKRCDRQTDGQTDRHTEKTMHRAAWWQLKRCDRQTRDRQTDRQTDWSVLRAAWSQLKRSVRESLIPDSNRASGVPACKYLTGWHHHATVIAIRAKYSRKPGGGSLSSKLWY